MMVQVMNLVALDTGENVMNVCSLSHAIAPSRITRKCCLLIVAVMISACAPQMRITPGQIPNAELPASDTKLEAESYINAEMRESGFREIRNGAQLRQVRNIVNRLERAAGYPSNTFPVHLIDAGDEANAMVYHGASVVVYKGLVDKVQTDNQLAVVLAHELGHVLGKHAEDEENSGDSAVSIASSLLGTVVSVAMTAAGHSGGNIIGDLTESTTSLIGTGLVRRFDRRQEYEADHLGLLLLAKAGIDPREALTFWEGAEEVFDTSSTKLGAFFSTHPAFSDRKQALEEALPFAMEIYEKR
ncbi:MAG: M48 family metallopeptidase [Bdellovibrionales bacterium]|nr:M48 family metallopeptidase [Bdellovibrionales bacterium]